MSACASSSSKPPCSGRSSPTPSSNGKNAKHWPGGHGSPAGASSYSHNRRSAGSLPPPCYRDSGGAERIRIPMMDSPKLDVPSDAGHTWGGLKLLPSTVWIALVVVLAVIAAAAMIGEGWGRFIAMTVVSLVLLAVIVRLFAGEAARQRTLRHAAEKQAAEFERLIAVRTRELSELSSHWQQFAEKEKSRLDSHLDEEVGRPL